MKSVAGTACSHAGSFSRPSTVIDSVTRTAVTIRVARMASWLISTACADAAPMPAAQSASVQKPRCMSEVEQVGDFDDEGALDELAAGCLAAVVVDDVDVAEG